MHSDRYKLYDYTMFGVDNSAAFLYSTWGILLASWAEDNYVTVPSLMIFFQLCAVWRYMSMDSHCTVIQE
jgi:hypothetical protein